MAPSTVIVLALPSVAGSVAYSSICTTAFLQLKQECCYFWHQDQRLESNPIIVTVLIVKVSDTHIAGEERFKLCFNPTLWLHPIVPPKP